MLGRAGIHALSNPVVLPFLQTEREVGAAWTRYETTVPGRFLDHFSGKEQWPAFLHLIQDAGSFRHEPVGEITEQWIDEDWSVRGYKVSAFFVMDTLRRINADLAGGVLSLLDFGVPQRVVNRMQFIPMYRVQNTALARDLLNRVLFYYRRVFEDGSLVVNPHQVTWKGHSYPACLVTLVPREEESLLGWQSWLRLLVLQWQVLGIGRDLEQLWPEPAGFYRDIFRKCLQVDKGLPESDLRRELFEVDVFVGRVHSVVADTDPEWHIQVPQSVLGRPAVTLQPAIRMITLNRGWYAMRSTFCYAGSEGGCHYVLGQATGSSWALDRLVSCTVLDKRLLAKQLTAFMQNRRIASKAIQRGIQRMQECPCEGSWQESLLKIALHSTTKSMMRSITDPLFQLARQAQQRFVSWPETLYDLWDVVFVMAGSSASYNARRLVGRSCLDFAKEIGHGN